MGLFTCHGTCSLLGMARRAEFTGAQEAILAPFIPVQPRRADGRGRPRKHDDRAVLNGVLWVLRTGAAWSDLPERCLSASTGFRRFSRWVKGGVMRRLLEALARDLDERGQIDLAECCIDGIFVVAIQGMPLKPPSWDAPDDFLGIVPTTVIRSIKPSRPKASSGVHRIAATVSARRPRRVAPCGAIAAGGRSNACSPG
jgi:transposase